VEEAGDAADVDEGAVGLDGAHHTLLKCTSHFKMNCLDRELCAHTSRVINMLTVSLQHFDRKAGVVNEILIQECVRTDSHYPLLFQPTQTFTYTCCIAK